MSWKRLIRAVVILSFVLYFEASIQLALHLHQLTCTLWNFGRKITFLFFFYFFPYWSAFNSEKWVVTPSFIFHWISIALGMIYIVIFWKKKNFLLLSTVLKRQIDWLCCSLSGWTLRFMSSGILSTPGLLLKSPIVYIVYLPHETLAYPPKIYLPTLIIVTVGPLPSHREWNVLAAQPSTDARQQRLQRE